MEIEKIFYGKFSGRRAPNFFVAYRLQTLRIECMKLVESPTAFWKNMDNIFFLLGTDSNDGLVPVHFQAFRSLFCLAIATYFICLAVCLWIFAVALR